MTKPTEIHVPQDDRTRPVTICMYEAERKRAVAGIEPVVYALSDAGNVFELIHHGLATGHFGRNDAGLISLTNICAAHFKALADTEGEHLLMLHRTLRTPDHAQTAQEE